MKTAFPPRVGVPEWSRRALPALGLALALWTCPLLQCGLVAGDPPKSVSQNLSQVFDPLTDTPSPTEERGDEVGFETRSKGRAVEEESVALAEKVENLVQQLGAVRLADREAAEQALMELGPAVLALLPDRAVPLPAEIAQRIRRIRRRLERQVAASVAEATRVTLSPGAKPVGQLLASIAEQTGNRIVFPSEKFPPDRQPRVDIELRNVPFWQALDAVLDQARLDADVFGRKKAVYVVKRNQGRAPRRTTACYRGPFRIAPALVTIDRSVGKQPLAGVTVYLELAWEPRLAPIQLSVPFARFAARDWCGNDLLRSGMRPNLVLPVFPQAAAVKIPVGLKLPRDDLRKIALLRGSIGVLLPGKPHTFRFPHFKQAAGTEQRVAMATVRLDEVRSDGSSWECRIRVRFDRAGDALQSHLTWVFDNDAYLLDKAGRKLEYQSLETTLQEENQVGVAYRFQLSDSPQQYTFVYETPVLFVEKTIDFELHDIALPRSP